MAELSKTKEEKEVTKAVLTLVDAARLADKNPAECLSAKDYGNTVVVVTVAGEKLTVTKNAKG